MKIDLKWKAAQPEPDRETVLADSKANPLRPDPTWKPAGPDVPAILAHYPDPLGTLSEAGVPAFVLRGAYPPSSCESLIRRLISRQLMPDPGDPAVSSEPRKRIDIGTSLGNRGEDREAFLGHAAGTQALFQTLF